MPPAAEVPKPAGPSLALWGALALFASLAFPIYMPLVMTAPLRDLADRPVLLTTIFAGAAAVSLLLAARARRRVAPRSFRLLAFGTALGIAGAAFLATYVFALSRDLPAPSHLAAGAAAPDFRATTHDGREISLSGFRGAPVLLVFYRGRW